MVIAFWVLTALLLYTYGGYAIAIALLGRLRRLLGLRRTPPAIENWPGVTLFVAVHNEEGCLPAKLKNTAELQYPGQLDVVFVLDGCTDGSQRVIEEYIQSTGTTSMKAFPSPGRVGKEKALRLAMAETSTPVMAFSDADAMYVPTMIRQLVEALHLPQAGASTGRELHLVSHEAGNASGEGLYYNYNNWVKRSIGSLSSQTEVYGGVFAIWREHYPAVIEPGLTQDGVVAMSLALKGLRVEFVPDALSTEVYTLDTSEDFRRRVRTISRAFTSILHYRRALMPWNTGWYGLHVVSHRALPWFLVPVLIAQFVLSCLLFNEHWIYKVALAVQVAFYAAAAIGWTLECLGRRFKPFYVPYYFLYLHVAAFCAVCQVLAGRRVTRWNPSTRAKLAAGEAPTVAATTRTAGEPAVAESTPLTTNV